MADVALHIEGMTCGACAARVDKALHDVPGVETAAVNLTTGMASVRGKIDEQQIVAAVERAGYGARVLGGSAAATLRELGQRGHEQEQAVRFRLWIGALAGIPVVLIDLFADRFVHLHSEQEYLALSLAQWLLTTVVMLTAGRPFFTGAWRMVRHGSANMDVLVALGTGVSFGYSTVLLALESMGRVPMHAYHLEFHAAVTIIVLVTLGKFLEARAKRRASSAVAGLATQTAATATLLLADGTSRNVPAEQVAVGDRVQVLAHQTLPVDGEVVEGSGAVDLSVVTGESVPVDVGAGTTLPGGAVLADGRVVLRATSTAAASTVARIVDLVNAAQASKTQIQGLADRVAAVFVPIVLVLAAATFAGWLLIRGIGAWETGLVASIATVVIACPCAMGLATPTAITVALGTAARRGVLFTNAAALELARGIATVAFDKTGTLTEGRPRVATVQPSPSLDAPVSELDLLRLAASAEQFSEHPLAKAIVAAAQEKGLTLLEPEEFSSAPGGGIKARFAGTGEVVVGSATFVESCGASLDGAVVHGLTAKGQSVVVIAAGARMRGAIGLSDVLRAESRDTIAQLRAAGLRVGVLSGDSEVAVRGALQEITVDFVKAGIRPEEKAATIADLQSDKSKIENRKSKIHVAFVGDGINDGPALAAADLGIAMAGGTDLAKAAGDVLLVGNRLSTVPLILELSRRTLRIIKQNLFWAFAYNVAAIPLAMLGILPPAAAAAAMMLSSLTVVGNALRLYGVGRSSMSPTTSRS